MDATREVAHKSTVHAWSYNDNGPNGPSNWGHNLPISASGTSQSPIALCLLSDSLRESSGSTLQYFDFSNYAITDGVTLTLKNVGGHTVKVIVSGTPIYIKGGSLPATYQLAQFHFHWGSNDTEGSEHTLGGRKFPLEMHFVHTRSDVTADQPQGLAAIAFVFETGAHNDNFDVILDNLDEVEHPDRSATVPTFSLLNLLPPINNMDYFRYSGSLTTPPCYESVVWSVVQKAITISSQQVSLFRTLLSSKGKHITGNFRPLQQLNGRVVTTTQHDNKTP